MVCIRPHSIQEGGHAQVTKLSNASRVTRAGGNSTWFQIPLATRSAPTRVTTQTLQDWGPAGAHQASGALSAVLQVANVLPGTVGLQPCHQHLQRATADKLLTSEDVLVQKDAGIPARQSETRDGCSSAPSTCAHKGYCSHNVFVWVLVSGWS